MKYCARVTASTGPVRRPNRPEYSSGNTSLFWFRASSCSGFRPIHSLRVSIASQRSYLAHSELSTTRTKHSCRKTSRVSPIHLLPQWPTPQTDLHLPRIPVAYSSPHNSLRPTKVSCRIQLSAQQPTTYQGFSGNYSVAYSYLHNSLRPVKVPTKHVQTGSIPSVQPSNNLQVRPIQSTF